MGKLRFLLKALILLIIIVLAASGCSTVNYDGKALVDSAAKKHTALESAHITVYDNISGVTVQEITYRFAGDVMQYMYIGRDAETGTAYYEFNNGTELDMRTVPDDVEWSFYTKGDGNYYSYSRASRHYFADGAQLFNDYEGAVSGTTINDVQGGGKTLDIEYDMGKLAGYSALSAYGRFSEFSERYVFDKNGLCVEYRNAFAVEGGEARDYTIRIEPRDEAQAIERIEITE